MKKGTLIIGGIIFLVLIGYLWWKSTYNGLVNMDEGVKAQLGQLNNVYQQRADLVPNLVETVKGSAIQERQTLTDVISARSRATGVQLTPEALKDPQAFQNFQRVQGDLSSALSRLMVVMEQYPQLRSQENFSVLMSQLEGQENRIRIERNRYNDVVREYNARVRSFPTSLIAGMGSFTQYPYFEAAAGAENAPHVNFGGNPEAAPGVAPSGAAGENVPNPATAPHGPTRPAPVGK
ncbi:MAG: LemA family protein [Bacteroidota bacterium]|nr:LemA family protein [Bacteroidota bacterium]MDP4232301.1 LemA family protein [Bacteroidota bacterium]MDP4241440.1 LemA family protein [Bacteroidota bacterium]MDP4286736.1 LemA family protein [Bacteroidota bacterium]